MNGKQQEQFFKALLSAFPTDLDLDKLIQFDFDEHPAAIAGGRNLEARVLELIGWARKHGRLDELLAKALARVPGNPDLRTFGVAYQTPKPVGGPNGQPGLPPKASQPPVREWHWVGPAGPPAQLPRLPAALPAGETPRPSPVTPPPLGIQGHSVSDPPSFDLAVARMFSGESPAPKFFTSTLPIDSDVLENAVCATAFEEVGQRWLASGVGVLEVERIVEKSGGSHEAVRDAIEELREERLCDWADLGSTVVSLTDRGRRAFAVLRHAAEMERVAAYTAAAAAAAKRIRMFEAKEELQLPTTLIEHVWRELEARGDIKVAWSDGHNDEVWETTHRFRRQAPSQP